MKMFESERNFRFPIRFTEDDVDHCYNCLVFSEYLLDVDSEADSVSFSLTSDDVKYLSRLLCREYNMMCDVIKASVSEGSDDDI